MSSVSTRLCGGLVLSLAVACGRSVAWLPPPAPSPFEWGAEPLAPAIQFTEGVAPGQIAMLVLDAHTGAPLSGVTVRIDSTSRVSFTDARGHVRFDRAVPGRCTLVIQIAGYYLQRRSITVTSSAGIALVVQMQRALQPQGDSLEVPDSEALVIHSFKNGLVGARANDVNRLSVIADSADGQDSVLVVEYSAPNGNPAARDVRLEAEHTNWSEGKALRFQVRPDHPSRISVSFVDRNGVAYTAWKNLRGAVWQTVRVGFDEIRPNPYFQPPGAKLGRAIDVGEVKWVAFAPQDLEAGRLEVRRVELVK